ncbi:MAG: heme A synthase [Candidatus Accumulibacter phosphatis]|uniref:Heme A synthase n=2 Tax=Candidatus Accumulibacter TaxID=327159 RepID=A0A080M1A0_9PROT|nr:MULTISPECIES: heme A synthase [Candidatus Accumulibacter]HNO36215.1 heme A synthase [Nitrospira sp.]KFB75023.1 MAG: Heme A synthase [Candidatus Accumulibacter cognatus]MBL8401067.1 heme A synthase [Accumulibacter sp.]MBN8519760.1 heme A synthase [Accumulibacter sp.]MBO3711447.1 heme A synthase [Accumulibacter sp.]
MDKVARRQVALWLLICSAMVFAILVVGGVTRLTHSGLSIVEWQPIVGVIPPLNPAEWDETFEKYKKTPEYQQVNHQMTLAEFKSIFYWEYWHRVLGRLIGLVFLLPFLYFLLRRRIAPSLVPKLLGIFVLGGLQGAMGWYMVKSGLVDDPRVSHYRLTAHLSLAFLIFLSMFWVALGLLSERGRGSRDVALKGLQRTGFWLTILVGYMVMTGGFVAGIRAGKAYNSFPLMNGHVLPPESFIIDPWYLNFFNNMALVQFDHRLGAWLLVFLMPWFWWKIRNAVVSSTARMVATLLLAGVLIQIALGIATLLLAVPVGLGAAHQGGAMVVLGLLLWLNHELRVARVSGDSI